MALHARGGEPPSSRKPGPMISTELIRALPKTDLHVHLDGSLREQTLIDLAASHRAFAALDEAFESGTIEAEVRKEAGQTVYRSPEAEFEASVTVSTHGEVWVADTYHYELPRSMCSDAVG